MIFSNLVPKSFHTGGLTQALAFRTQGGANCIMGSSCLEGSNTMRLWDFWDLDVSDYNWIFPLSSNRKLLRVSFPSWVLPDHIKYKFSRSYNPFLFRVKNRNPRYWWFAPQDWSICANIYKKTTEQGKSLDQLWRSRPINSFFQEEKQFHYCQCVTTKCWATVYKTIVVKPQSTNSLIKIDM